MLETDIILRPLRGISIKFHPVTTAASSIFRFECCRHSVSTPDSGHAARFQLIPYVCERGLKIGSRSIYRDLSNNLPFEANQGRLFATHGHDQIESRTA